MRMRLKLSGLLGGPTFTRPIVLSSSTKVILLILAGALVAVLLTLSSFNMRDEQFEPAYILIAYGAPILLLVLVLLWLGHFVKCHGNRFFARDPMC